MGCLYTPEAELWHETGVPTTKEGYGRVDGRVDSVGRGEMGFWG
jgi:hypothetical protein